MGFAKSFVHFLVKEHHRKNFKGPALALGHQHTFVTLAELKRMMNMEQLVPHELPSSMEPITQMPNWDYGKKNGFLDDKALIYLLAGIALEALDVSEYEKATYIRNLNQPVGESLHNKFGLIIDGGTIEHIFDVRSTLTNISNMLAIGGRIIHITQASNWIGHGFYQFSPTLFYDYYGINGFEDMHCYLVRQGRSDVTRIKWKWYHAKPHSEGPVFLDKDQIGIVFVATKGAESSVGKCPGQGEFGQQSMWATIPNQVERSGNIIFQNIKQFVPTPLKEVLRLQYLKKELWEIF